jgi:hypothetical protein
LSKKRHFFAKFFGENILKIITSVPDLNLYYYLRLAPYPAGDCRQTNSTVSLFFQHFGFRDSTSSQCIGGHDDHYATRGCQMVYFHPKNPNLGIFLRALEWIMLIYFMAFWII